MNSLEMLLELIRRFEGCQLKAYKCPAGVWTCGWGSTGNDVTSFTVWTQEIADERLMKDALQFLNGTKRLCPDLNEHQTAAIADFSYNLGLGALEKSTLRKKILSKRYWEVPDELRKWVNAGGRVLKGLQLRREAEIKLFNGGV